MTDRTNNFPLDYSPAKACERGFSLIEMLITLGLLVIVLGVVVRGVMELQARNFTETGKTDAVQEARDFIDQMSRDIHGSGFPPPSVTNQANPNCADGFGNVNATVRNNANIACGIVAFSTTAVTYEADLDGSGTVSVVYLQLVPPTATTSCPCQLQRGTVTKAQWVANNAIVPAYFTTVNGVLNSGNGAGAATYTISLNGPGTYTSYGKADAFDAYNANATLITTACSLTTNPDCTQIRSLQISANVAPSYYDPITKLYPVYSITSKARINF